MPQFDTQQQNKRQNIHAEFRQGGEYSKRCPLPPPKNQTEERDKFFGHRVGHHLPGGFGRFGVSNRYPCPSAQNTVFLGGNLSSRIPPSLFTSSLLGAIFPRKASRGAASARHKETTTFTSHLSLTSKSSKILCGGMLQRNPMNTGTDSMNSTECGFSATGVS